MPGAILRFAVALIFLTGLGSQALAAKRIALVIGNDAYQNLPAQQQLKNAINDARAIRKALENLNFEVLYGENLSRGAFVDKLFDFTSRISDGDISLFFYAGHGVAIKGGNYFLPSDIQAPQSNRRQEEDRIVAKSIAEVYVLNSMKSAGARVAIAVLDACRDNPLAAPDGRSLGSGRGLTRIHQPTGVFSIYSAGLNQQALDRLPDDQGQVNSVFTRVFVKNLMTPGLNLYQLARATRQEVVKLANSVGRSQIPAIYDQVVGDHVYLAGNEAREIAVETKPAAAAPQTDSDELARLRRRLKELEAQKTASIPTQRPAPAPRPAPATPPKPVQGPNPIELAFWDAIKNGANESLFESYLQQFPNGAFTVIAQARIAALQKKVPEVAARPRPKPGAVPEEQTADAPVHDCDRLAASPFDVQKVVAGVKFSELKAEDAIRACQKARNDYPGVKRFDYQLSRAYIKTGQYAESLQLTRELAEKKYVAAMTNLGVHYANGLGASKDDRQAAHWYRLAAEEGEVVAMYHLGLSYAHGRGVEQNAQEAVRWLEKATDGDNVNAMMMLARMYSEGRGVARDMGRAADWVLHALTRDLEHVMGQITDASIFTKPLRQGLQRRMKERGVYSGPIDGDFGPASKRAIKQLAKKKVPEVIAHQRPNQGAFAADISTTTQFLPPQDLRMHPGWTIRMQIDAANKTTSMTGWNFDLIAQLLGDGTNNTMRIEVLPANTVVIPGELALAVAAGILELGIVSTRSVEQLDRERKSNLKVIYKAPRYVVIANKQVWDQLGAYKDALGYAFGRAVSASNK